MTYVEILLSGISLISFIFGLSCMYSSYKTIKIIDDYITAFELFLIEIKKIKPENSHSDYTSQS